MTGQRASLALALASASILVSGCASTSFAPPLVNLKKEASISDYENANFGRCSGRTSFRGTLTEDFGGAMKLIDNFTEGYRCAANSAAEGRANFEVPAFLFAITAALGQPLGLSEDATLAIGAAGLTSAQGNSYFAPREKAGMLNSALDAVNCVQLEAVGLQGFASTRLDGSKDPLSSADKSSIIAIAQELDVNPYGYIEGRNWLELLTVLLASADADEPQKEQLEKFRDQITGPAPAIETAAEKKGRQMRQAEDARVTFGAEAQYFRLVRASLLSIERTLARRLSNAGTPFDIAGVLAQARQFDRDEQEQQGGADSGQKAFAISSSMTQDEINRRIVVEVKQLRPRLEKCTLLAKL